jgi:hypothetical protein
MFDPFSDSSSDCVRAEIGGFPAPVTIVAAMSLRKERKRRTSEASQSDMAQYYFVMKNISPGNDS